MVFIPQKKALSQVFLKEDWPCRRLASLLKEAGVSHVLEIGPGGGILTQSLLDAGLYVTAVERDPRFVTFLEKKYKDQSIEIVSQDILSFSLSNWILSHEGHGRLGICGNIPYHISTDILLWLLPYLSQVSLGTFLVQYEFAKRVCATSHDKEYGSISVYTQLRSQAHFEYFVPKELFSPIPKVDSGVMSLKPLEKPFCDADLLDVVEKICRQAFSQRRKKLSNSLSVFAKAHSSFALSLDPYKNLRCENLSLDDFCLLAQALKKIPKI